MAEDSPNLTMQRVTTFQCSLGVRAGVSVLTASSQGGGYWQRTYHSLAYVYLVTAALFPAHWVAMETDKCSHQGETTRPPACVVYRSEHTRLEFNLSCITPTAQNDQED